MCKQVWVYFYIYIYIYIYFQRGHKQITKPKIGGGSWILCVNDILVTSNIIFRGGKMIVNIIKIIYIYIYIYI